MGLYGQDTMALYEENLLSVIEGFFNEIDNDIISENVEVVNEMKRKVPFSEKINKLIEKIKEFIKRMLLRIKAILRAISTATKYMYSYIKSENGHVVLKYNIIDKPDMLDASKVFKDFDPKGAPKEQQEVIDKINKTYEFDESGIIKHDFIFTANVVRLKVVDFGKYNTEEEKKELEENAKKFIKDNKIGDSLDNILNNNVKYIESLEKSITDLKQKLNGEDDAFWLEWNTARLKNTLHMLKIVNQFNNLAYSIAKMPKSDVNDFMKSTS